MNLYIRYFDKETLVTNVDDAIAFLRNIDEIGMNPVLEAEIREYVSSEVFYPKRYKVRPRIYFIIINLTIRNIIPYNSIVLYIADTNHFCIAIVHCRRIISILN